MVGLIYRKPRISCSCPLAYTHTFISHGFVCTSSIIWYQSKCVMPRREGNCRSGVAVAVHHELKWLIHIRAQGLREISIPCLLSSNVGWLVSSPTCQVAEWSTRSPKVNSQCYSESQLYRMATSDRYISRQIALTFIVVCYSNYIFH